MSADRVPCQQLDTCVSSIITSLLPSNVVMQNLDYYDMPAKCGGSWDNGVALMPLNTCPLLRMYMLYYPLSPPLPFNRLQHLRNPMQLSLEAIFMSVCIVKLS